MAVNPWHVTTNKIEQRRLGKTTEELAELLAVVGRIGIQGIDEIDPSSGHTNRQRLTEEMADVWAQLELLKEHYHLDVYQLSVRKAKKIARMHEWDRLVAANDTNC